MRERAVGDVACDFEDAVACLVETGHFAVDPDEGVVRVLHPVGVAPAGGRAGAEEGPDGQGGKVRVEGGVCCAGEPALEGGGMAAHAPGVGRSCGCAADG